jgi:hypothetical protein
LESSLHLTLKMASDVGDPDALDGFVGLGWLRTSRIYTVPLLRIVNAWRRRRSTLTVWRDRPVVTTTCKKLSKNGEVSSIGVLFIPRFVKIGQLVSKLKLWHSQTAWLSPNPTYLLSFQERMGAGGRRDFLGGWGACHNPITKELTLIKFCYGDHRRNISKSCFIFVT